MSETTANGQNGAAAPAGPTLTINAQYLRDLSFENPRAPESLLAQGPQPEVKIEVEVKGRQLNPTTFESVTSIKLEARQGEQVAFVVEADYAAVVTILNAPQEIIGALVLVETPRLTFPFIRNIIASATRDGGFPPLLINPIDFAEVQRRSAAAQGLADTPPAANA
jgi:preprotein translocase subunit SecB